jgi:hypothetical protein
MRAIFALHLNGSEGRSVDFIQNAGQALANSMKKY